MFSTATKNISNILKCRAISINPFVTHNLPLISIQASKAHTDIKVPDFTKYMRESVKDPTTRTSDSDAKRKVYTNTITAVGLTLGLYSVKGEIIREVLFMAASADILALARIEINLAEIPEGISSTFKWRGKPLFVKRRTEEEIAVSRAVPLKSLRDPATDEERCPRPEWLVAIGICTHLGCVPLANAGDYGPGGYYCPCHGSHFDAAGRIRKGPAPTNMEIPEHQFVSDDKLIVG